MSSDTHHKIIAEVSPRCEWGSASFCGYSGCLIVLFCIRIDCICVAFPRCASWYAFWGWKHHCMNSCTVGTCAVSPRCEWGSDSSDGVSYEMTCCIVGKCNSWPHCDSDCGRKGCSYLQMSSGTSHKIFVWTFSIVTSTPFWRPLIIGLNQIERNSIKLALSLFYKL